MRFEETRPVAFEFMQKDEKDGKKPPLEPDMKKLVERVQPFLRPELLQRALGSITSQDVLDLITTEVRGAR